MEYFSKFFMCLALHDLNIISKFHIKVEESAWLSLSKLYGEILETKLLNLWNLLEANGVKMSCN